MNKNIRKKLIIPSIYLASFLIVAICVLVVGKSVNYYLEKNESIKTTNKDIVKDTKPVIKEQETNIIKPYTDKNISIGKYFYDYESDSTKQEKSIVYYENTYMQNSGVDYINNTQFDVLNVLDGEIITVKEDKNLGNIVEIKHDKDIITVYQGLDKVNIKKGETVKQGYIIGTSGTSEINKDYKSYVHFEVYYKGKLIDPESFYSLNVKDL